FLFQQPSQQQVLLPDQAGQALSAGQGDKSWIGVAAHGDILRCPLRLMRCSAQFFRRGTQLFLRAAAALLRVSHHRAYPPFLSHSMPLSPIAGQKKKKAATHLTFRISGGYHFSVSHITLPAALCFRSVFCPTVCTERNLVMKRLTLPAL